MRAERCPICGGVPQYVHYAIPIEVAPDEWDFNEYEEIEPTFLLKRIECSECGATVTPLVLTCDGAVECWNKKLDGHRIVLLRYRTEPCRDVAPPKEDPSHV